MNLKIFSKALYSSWCYYSPIRTLFDVGEGVATNMGNEIYAPERICIGHGHGDHVLGLPSFIGCRNSGRGDKNKPLIVYAPESDSFSDLKDFILKRNPQLSYPLEFVQVIPGTIVPINEKIHIEAFEVKHCYNSVGYKVVESRKRLKNGILPGDAKKLKQEGADIYEEYNGINFVWLLDSHSFDLSHIENAHHVIFDATFLREKDRDDNTHASVEEVFRWATEKNVKRVTLAHISTRYSFQEVIDFCNKEFVGKTFKWDIVLGNEVYQFS